MFKRHWRRMPKLPEFGTTLEQLGYKVAGNDQVVDSEGNFFKFFVSDTDQVNLKHKEAAHEATRTVIFDKLGEYEVKKVYLQGGDGLFCTHDLPPRENPYVQILATDLKELKKKSDVVVVIPDHNMDLGTVSYRELMGPGGIERGSVLGLVKELSGMEFTQLPKVCIAVQFMFCRIPLAAREMALTSAVEAQEDLLRAVQDLVAQVWRDLWREGELGW